MNKKWECYNNNIEEVQKIAKNFNVSNLLATILSNKNISSENEIEKFLNPTRNDFYDPFLMPDMKIAVDRILEAMSKKEKIIIYGDYDVDGITSITVLKQFLEDRGIEVGQYIPNRLNEGYGLNKKAIEEIVKQKYTLMITVDCGISGVEEVEYANSLGIETIITDHHEQGEEIPNALAVVDAKRKDNKYPFNQLAGVGVVFKLIQALGICLGLEEKEYLKYLDLVCVGTISDIVPLVDENRVIAKLGLKLVQVTKNIGLKTLLDTVGYKKIDSITISFGVAPRINACGRMGFQNEALDLFLTKSEKEAKEISDRLNEYNRERQDTEKKIFSEALQKIEKSEKDKPCIILGSENWHHGVIGIVASKVTDMYFKPSILICFEDGIGKGSGRSVPGFDLHEALSKCDKYVEKFGGHSMAIGITVTQDNFNKFKEEFEEYTKNSDIDKIVPIIYIDQEVTLKDINLKAAKELQLLEPFGEGNKMPLFLYKNLRIDSIRALSEGKHLKLTLKDDNYIIDAIGFNMGALANEYLIGDKIDVVGTLEINSFNNVEKIQINLKDVRKSY
ncbi:MAG: single-stranded-DNA-specific exonuclease RecJ [Clostridia bacterium]|jgi:single-stranded-DNA-specific exonuclease|nr:single-stranded-DNA-specific exonuclease RecJ [Clostridiaceae bacterium]